MKIKYKVLNKDGKQIARAWSTDGRTQKLEDFPGGDTLWYAESTGWVLQVTESTVDNNKVSPPKKETKVISNTKRNIFPKSSYFTKE